MADLYVPVGPGARPVVVLVHGGFWRAEYDRSLMAPLAVDLVAKGYAAWNIEYRRIGEAGGGWPGTFLDVAAAVDALAEEAAVDHDRVVSCGHSAGGHLALWIAARSRIAAGGPGANPPVRVAAAVSQAGVADLARGWSDALGGEAVAALMGGSPAALPDRYAAGDPAALLPLGVAQLLVHGEADGNVPVSQSIDYAAKAATAGDDVAVVTFPRTDHFAMIDPTHPSWTTVTDRLPKLIAGRTS
ncbi:MAG: alpha/beta hydrolase family protein [Acidimicrobiales bacterium]